MSSFYTEVDLRQGENLQSYHTNGCYSISSDPRFTMHKIHCSLDTRRRWAWKMPSSICSRATSAERQADREEGGSKKKMLHLFIHIGNCKQVLHKLSIESMSIEI